MNQFVIGIALLLLIIAPLGNAIYYDATDKRLDTNQYISSKDTRINQTVYVDPRDQRNNTLFSSINYVFPNRGNIQFLPGSGIVITNDKINSQIRIDANADINATSPVNWSRLQNFPGGCGAGQAVQVIGTTLTCISVSGGFTQADANLLYVKLNPIASQVISGNKNLLINGDLNVTSANASVAAATFNNTGGGDSDVVRFQQLGVTTATFSSIFGFPFIRATPGTGFFGYGYDLANIVGIGDTGVQSLLNDADGWSWTGVLNLHSNLFADFNVNALDGNFSDNLYAQQISSKTNIFADRNINGFDGNFSDNLYAQNISSKTNIQADLNGNFKDVNVSNGIYANFIESKTNIIGDANGNFLDGNISRNLNLQNLRLNGNILSNIIPDVNFIRNIGDGNHYDGNIFTEYIYVDKNIYASTFQTAKSAVFVLNTCYTNGGLRDMVIYGDVNTNLRASNDIAILHIFVNTCSNPGGILQEVGTNLYTQATGAVGEAENRNFPFSFLVPKGKQFQLTSQVKGTGALSLNNISSYFP